MSIDIHSLSTYDYPLLDEQIAKEPLIQRDKSKLLVYQRDKTIEHYCFTDLPNLLPSDTLLIRNVAKVVQARLFFERKSGAVLEVFCLEPLLPSPEISIALSQKGEVVWKCMVKKLKKWSIGEELHLLNADISLTAKLLDRGEKEATISFHWSENISWGQIMEQYGNTHIPPYLHREATKKDVTDYQTVYAKIEGAVAAPTAGLHFTADVIQALKQKHISMEDVVLHVSAGTFQPVEKEDIRNHNMHTEKFSVDLHVLLKLYHHKGQIISVGTTSLRVLESLFWLAYLIKEKKDNPYFISQYLAYENADYQMNYRQALEVLIEHCKAKNLSQISAQTQIFIHSGYKIKSVNGLITNFHQPKSTLLMLIASIIGDDWQRIYQSALENKYRFLSYGDSSLIWV